MKATTTWLSEPEKSLIADQAIELLATTGMRFAGSEVLPLLEARGARVDAVTGIARLPRDLVEWAITQCPRSFVMAGATPEDDVLLGEGESFHFAPSGCVAKTLDFRTGIRRPSTLQDLRECTALMDELPQMDLMWTQVSATDVPLDQRELVEYFTMLTETSMHVTFVDCPTEVDAVIRLCEVMSGDLERFRERPRISTVVTAASPLQVDGNKQHLHDLGCAPVIKDLSGYIRDVSDTLSIMKDLDLVVTIESAVGHIATLAGIETWVPYSYQGRDWRVGVDGSDQIWSKYRVFPQGPDMVWQPTFDRIVEALREKADESR